MDEYHNKVFRAHLEREPEKFTVSSLKTEATEVGMLKPKVKSIRIYAYPNEHAVVLEGENLWFCHEVDLGEGDALIRRVKNSNAITGRSIQFSYEPTGKSDLLVTHHNVKVTLRSHFANPIRNKDIIVEQVHKLA